MEITDTAALDYLHDATLISLRYDPSGPNRIVVLEVHCHPDAGYPAWNGRRLTLRLEDLPLLWFRCCGSCAGKEFVDAWRPAVSTAMEAELCRLGKSGLRVSGNRFTLTFSTGSCIEGVAGNISVEVGP